MKTFPVLIGAALMLSASMSQASESHHWSYHAGKTSPAHWGELESDYAVCKTGQHQSPINIETKKVKSSDAEPIKLAYSSVNGEVQNTGHSIQVNLDNGGSVTLDGVEYKLVQFHFHTPSEEKIDGKSYAMVAHLVHKNAEGKLAVVAVLFKQGKESQALEGVFASLPAKEGDRHPLAAAINAGDLLPADHAGFTFAGSLTTPPCSEDVSWVVLKTPMTISSQQLTAFKRLYPVNARPTQPLHGRVVHASR